MPGGFQLPVVQEPSAFGDAQLPHVGCRLPGIQEPFAVCDAQLQDVGCRLPVIQAPSAFGDLHGAPYSSHALPAVQATPHERDSINKCRGVIRQAKRQIVQEPKVRACLRTNCFDDLGTITDMWGTDLLHVPVAWLDPVAARDRLANALDIEMPAFGGPVFLLEVFAGSANLTRACLAAGYSTGPPIDVIAPPGGGRRPFDILKACDRQLIWAMVLCFEPRWIHSGFPCTFWSPMAHFTRNQAAEVDERTRLTQLVFIVFTRQLCLWQVQRGRHASIENPCSCASWKLDVIVDTISSCKLKCVDMHMCMWGACDPGNGLPYKKPMRVGASIDLTPLVRKCQSRHQHQTVHGTICSGVSKGKKRSTISGHYPPEFCNAWVEHMHTAICS